MTDANQWPTIKIPERDREGARRAAPTYGELVSMGVVAYRLGLVSVNSDGRVTVDSGESDGATVSDVTASVADGFEWSSEDIEAVEDQLDRIESSAATAEERAGRIESTLEGLQR